MKKTPLWRRILGRVWGAFTHKEIRGSPEEVAKNLEGASALPPAKAPKFGRWWMLGLSFRTWKIITFGIIISFLNWAFWSALDALGGINGLIGGISTGLQEIPSWLLGTDCWLYLPSEGGCTYLPNVFALMFVLLIVIPLLAFAIDGLLKALKMDEESKQKEQRDLVVAAVLAAIKADKAYDEAMRENQRFREEDERRRGLRD